MRTLREIAGFGLLLGVFLTPFLGLIALIAMVEGDAPCAFLLFVGLLVLALPRMWLSARRLREPSPMDVAEADGRRPVLLLHRFARVSESVWSRLLLPAPGLLRDLVEAHLERKLTRQLEAVGPVVPITRSAPPWLDDPSVPVVDPKWEEELERQFRRAAMIVIVLDGSEANAREIERSFTVFGPRTVLVLPPRADDGFEARYEVMRGRIPLLPPLSDPHAKIIRYDAQGRASLLRSLELLDGERVPAPKAPAISWLLTALPFGASWLAVIAAPLVLDAHGVDLDGEDIAAWTFGVLGLGVVLSVMTRRYVRLVPANEVTLVGMAASPWIVLELIKWLSSDDASQWELASRLEHTATAAAYAAPLLTSVALVLAGASLIRHAPGRQPIYAALGAASVVPIALLALSLREMGADILFVALIVNAIALALAAWGASGEGGRAHAPLPIGAGIAAALSIAACAILVSHEQWRILLAQSTPMEAARIVTSDGMGSTLRTFERVWPWLVLIVPAVVVLVGTRFARRASRTAIASLAAFAPMMIAVTLAIDAEASARHWFDHPYAGANVDPLLPADGVELASGFALPEVFVATPTYNHADVVIDSSGAIVAGRLIATAAELDGFRATGGPPMLTRELARLGRDRAYADPVRISARRDLASSSLLGALASARTAGWPEVELMVFAAGEIRSVHVRPRDGRLGRTPGDIPIYLRLGAYQAAVDDTVGAQFPVPRIGDALDENALRQALATQQSVVPGRTTIHVNVDPSVPVVQLVQGAAHGANFFPTVLVTDGAYSQ